VEPEGRADRLPPRVFCASLADVFDNEVEQAWRDDLWQLLRETPNLRWILLTKRIGNARKMLPADWPFPNAGLMSTLENQEVWDRDYPKLAATRPRGAAFPPSRCLADRHRRPFRPGLDHHRRRERPRISAARHGAVRSLRDQCARNGITFHHKQNGGVRGKDAGCLVDGVEHKHFPPALAA
jgi:protein gp37